MALSMELMKAGRRTSRLVMASFGPTQAHRTTTADLTTTIGSDPERRSITSGVLDDSPILVADSRRDPFAPSARFRALERP